MVVEINVQVFDNTLQDTQSADDQLSTHKAILT